MSPIRTLIVLGLGLLLAGCGGPIYTYRYRLTLAVEADGQVHTGSSVVEVSEWRTSEWSLEPRLVKTRVIGEATLVDLGRGRVLIALLEGIPAGTPRSERGGREWIGRSPTGLLVGLFGLNYQWTEARNDGLAELSRQRAVRHLGANQLPILVTFRNINDPKTLVVVDPNELPTTFGPGVQFKSATIEVTDAPIGTGIEETLPWLRTISGYLDGERLCDPRRLTRALPFCPDRGQFIRR